MAPHGSFRTTSAVVAACAICASVALSVPASASVSGPQALIDTGIVVDATNPDNTEDWFAGMPNGTVVVVTPGTDDTGLFPRINGIVGTRQALIVQYPEAIGPIVAGKSGKFPLLAPSYDASKQVAIDNNLAAMRVLSGDSDVPYVIWTGYSQGADALGNAAEEGYEEGLLDDNDVVLLVSDPRSPWGIKAFATKVPLLPSLLGVLGITSDGARDPAKTGDVEVISLIVKGDPVSNFQWVWYRPVSSLAVNVAGFFLIHSNLGSQDYENVDELGQPEYLLSEDGRTTYMVYNAYHPLAQATELLYKALGIEYSQEDLEGWHAAAEKFYPIQGPSVETAAVPVYDPLAPSTQQRSYAVTTPSEVATGEVPFEPIGSNTTVPEQPASQSPVEATVPEAQAHEASEDSQPVVVPEEEAPAETPEETTSAPTDDEPAVPEEASETAVDPNSSNGWTLPEDVEPADPELAGAAA